MATVTFWNNNDFKGISTPFTGAQRRAYDKAQAWDSLKTGAATWLVVWDNSDYTGNYLKVGPSNSTFNDLNHAGRGNGDNWQGKIKSLVIYANQPSWWNSSTRPPNNDLNLQPADTIFCSGTDFNDDTVVFTANVSEDDLNEVKFPNNTSDDMKNDIQSLATGSSAWLEIWNEPQYAGSTLQIYPNTTYSDLNNVAREPEGDWKNQIQSFKLYNSLPLSWKLGFDQDAFFGSFPDAIKAHDTSGDYYYYMTQDCSYDIRITGIAFDTDTMTVSFRIDYNLPGHNDKVLLDLVINADGSYNSVAYAYTQGDPTQIPKSVIKAVDVSAEVLGAVGALETAGISEEAANSFIEAFDTFCDVFNKVSNLVFKLSEANDGRFYMVAVCTQTLCRAYSAVTINN